MALFYEFLSLVVRREALVRASPARAARLARPSTRASGADEEIVRLGFMNPMDLEQVLDELEQDGLARPEHGGRDFAIVDQLAGICGPCDWLEVGRFEDSTGWSFPAVRVVGSALTYAVDPDGERVEGRFTIEL